MKYIDRIIKVIDQISIWSGKTFAWLIIPMAAALVWEVIIRYTYRPTLMGYRCIDHVLRGRIIGLPAP